MRKSNNIFQRELQKSQIKSRKAAREVLQFTSSQALPKTADRELAAELATANPSITQEFTMQQSLRYKDPAKNKETVCPNVRYTYENCTRQQLKGLLRPVVLKSDKGFFNFLKSV